jgi:stage II sporulation protein GA (sporulation sigma-E factor processing peptidase)
MKPVSIIEQDLIKDYIDNDEKPNLRVIPFKSIGKEQGIMYGIIVNQLMIEGVQVTDNAVLGLYDKKFSKNKGYHMILHPDVFAKEPG